MNVYSNPSYSSIMIQKLSQNSVLEDERLLKEENMMNIFSNIPIMHADDCPMYMFTKSLETNNLELNQSEFKGIQQIKLASVGIIKDKQVILF